MRAAIRHTPLIVGLIGIFVLGACSGPNPCGPNASGMCVDTRSVYGITNTRDQINPDKQTRVEQKKAQQLLDSPPASNEQLPNIDAAGATGANPNGVPSTATTTAQNVAAGKPPGTLGAALQMPQPILTQPEIMRVWVAPWIDDEGSLHWPGYTFLVVKREEWRFGTPEVQQSSVLTPLQVEPAVGMPQSAPGTGGSNPSSGQAPPTPPEPPPAIPGSPPAGSSQ